MGNFLECQPKKSEDIIPKKNEGEKKQGRTSEKVLEEFILELLKDPEINKRIVPDKIEKEFYLALLTTLMSSVIKVADTFRLEIMNHVLTIHIRPKEND
jgi:hypothetical protein